MSDIESPDLEFPELEDLCFTSMRAVIIWLQTCFGTRPIGRFRWRANQEESEITISANDPVGIDQTNKRPNITVSRSNITFAGTSISQLSQPAFANQTAVYTDLIRGQFFISVIAREGLEAQSIAYTIFWLIPLFTGVLNRLGNMRLEPNHMTMGSEQPYGKTAPGAVPDWKMVVIGLPFSAQDMVSIDSGKYYSFCRQIELSIEDLGK